MHFQQQHPFTLQHSYSRAPNKAVCVALFLPFSEALLRHHACSVVPQHQQHQTGVAEQVQNHANQQ
jgi:hypothetical protein